MRKRFFVREGRVCEEPKIEPAPPPVQDAAREDHEQWKVCRECGDSFPLNESNFRRKTNAAGKNKGWHPDCNACNALKFELWSQQL